MSICHWLGMLCDVRMASQPISFIVFIWRMSAALFTAAPKGPRSWCRQTPFSFRVTPLSWKPPLADTLTVRRPIFRVFWSRASPKSSKTFGLLLPSHSVMRSVYKFGVSGVHSWASGMKNVPTALPEPLRIGAGLSHFLSLWSGVMSSMMTGRPSPQSSTGTSTTSLVTSLSSLPYFACNVVVVVMPQSSIRGCCGVRMSVTGR